MKNVKLDLFILFFVLFFSHQGCADCPALVKSNTEIEAAGKKGIEWATAILSFGLVGSLKVDERSYNHIKVSAIKNQGDEAFFNPKIRVCDYESNNCYELPGGTNCQKLYGTQATGAGVSAAVFIDWEGNKTIINSDIGEGLKWDWAKGVIDQNTSQEEKDRLAKLPKICACSQKGACLGDITKYFVRVGRGANIFYPGETKNVCDTCYQEKVKCAPIPLDKGPPPFCPKLPMSPSQVRIVPISSNDNDYFNPKVKVIIGQFEGSLNFQNQGYQEVKNNKITHYFKTSKKEDTLCAEYHGTDTDKSKKFTRCFPAPPIPEPEILLKQGDIGSGMLNIRVKMGNDSCSRIGGNGSGNYCTFTITQYPKTVGPFALKVIKPKIVKKVAGDPTHDMIKRILESNKELKILSEQHGYVLSVKQECQEHGSPDNKGNPTCKLDNLGRPKVEFKYEESNKSKILCLSGWKSEESALLRDGEIHLLKPIGTRDTKYAAVYSKESKRFHYLPCKSDKIDYLVDRSQDKLNEIQFNMDGYISIGSISIKECTVDKDKDLKSWGESKCSKCAVYGLADGEYSEQCTIGEEHSNKKCRDNFKESEEGWICYNNSCSRPTIYKQHKDLFYLRVEQKQDESVEYKEHPIKADRLEVFDPGRFCKLDMDGLKKNIVQRVEKQLKNKINEEFTRKINKARSEYYEYSSSGVFDTDNLLVYGHLVFNKFEVIKQKFSGEEEYGNEFDVNSDYPIIKIHVPEDSHNKQNGKSIRIEQCKANKTDCLEPPLAIASGVTSVRIRPIMKEINRNEWVKNIIAGLYVEEIVNGIVKDQNTVKISSLVKKVDPNIISHIKGQVAAELEK